MPLTGICRHQKIYVLTKFIGLNYTNNRVRTILTIFVLLTTPTESAGVGSMFGSVCLSVHSTTQKRMIHLKVFKLAIRNDFRYPTRLQVKCFWVERSKV